ncbi:hypothetical protein SDC9_172290 [bioreactor metagenome]|uniref:Uncharacterized protein n=1 Tax=bioreactor metagenome TaxID=1076179 RepID=A0A645GDY2_9ZZZZ
MTYAGRKNDRPTGLCPHAADRHPKRLSYADAALAVFRSALRRHESGRQGNIHIFT